MNHLRADDNTLATGLTSNILLLVLRRAGLIIREAAAGTTAVKFDTVAGAGDAVALAGAAGAGAGDGGWGGRVGGAGGEGWDVRVGIGVVVGVGLLRIDGGAGEAGGERLDGGGLVVAGNDVADLIGLRGLGALDLGGREGATLGDVGGDAAGLAGGALGGSGSSLGGTGLGGGDVEDVELAAGGGLGGELAGGVVADVVAIDDVVVPVALALFERTLETEATLPATGLGCILRKRKLAVVVVPGAEEVDGLAVRGSAESEVKLDSGHCG